MQPDPAAVSNDELTVHRCGPGDRAEQARLFNRCFKKELDADALRWRYDACPHGASVNFVSRPPGGEAVCGYACSPRRVLVHGDASDPATVGETGDVMTDPAWRKRGIFSSLDAACMEATRELGWHAVFGLPNRRSAHIFVKLGWASVGTIRPWTFLLAGDARARAVRFREGRLTALRVPLDVGRCRRRRAGLARRGAGVSTRLLDDVPDAVGALSRKVARDFPFMVDRDAAYVRWRFLEGSVGLHRLIGAFGPDGAFAGYCAVQLPRDAAGTGYLVDLLAPRAEVRAALVAAGLAELERAGAAVVQATAVDGSWWSARLQEAGFLPPKPDNHLIVILWTHRGDHPLARAARDASRWYLTDGDRDDETMG